VRYGLESVREIVGRVWIWVLLGIAVGAGIHGYVPEGFIAGIMGTGSWWSVPVSVLIGTRCTPTRRGLSPWSRPC
jgi:hypothetical protein